MFINRCRKCTVHLKIFLRLNKGGAIECIYYISYKMYVHVCEEYVPEHKLNPLRMQGTVHATILNLLCVFQMVTSCGMKALFGLFCGTPKPTTLNAELNAQIITVSETAKLYTAFDLLKFDKFSSITSQSCMEMSTRQLSVVLYGQLSITLWVYFQALYDYQPSDNDVQPMKAWLAVMEAAHKNLARYTVSF